MDKKLMIAFLLVLVSFIWAGSFIVVDIITPAVDPIDLGFLRFLVATPLMFFLLFLRRKKANIPRKELPWLIVLGLTGVTLLYLFQFIGIDYTNASTAAVLINTNVIFIALLSVVFLRETLTKKRLIGIVLSFTGAVVVIFSNMSKGFSETDFFLMGSILMLLSALCWAIYSVAGKRLLKNYDSLTVTTYAFAFGTLFYLPFILPHLTLMFQTTSVNGWFAVIYLALACSVFGYLGWYYALQHTDASKAAVFLNFIPLFTILMSFLLGESITWLFLAGAILIIYGVYLTQRS